MKVFITGISRGIGLALAEAMLQEKMEVYGTVRNLNNEDVNGVKDLKKQFHQKLHLIKLDVTQENVKEQIVQHVPKDLTLDILINNAGVYHREVEPAIERLSRENLNDSIQVNLLGPILVTQALLPYLMNSENPKV
ncbi:MAG: SDR family NAD(P)-dependent oxidoreductase, partial [Bdellovibrionota bacterium]|nr:SDR family NAD(P)-dependent oxidoreductase [Bdellovibrionota bacterium]